MFIHRILSGRVLSGLLLVSFLLLTSILLLGGKHPSNEGRHIVAAHDGNRYASGHRDKPSRGNISAIKSRRYPVFRPPARDISLDYSSHTIQMKEEGLLNASHQVAKHQQSQQGNSLSKRVELPDAARLAYEAAIYAVNTLPMFGLAGLPVVDVIEINPFEYTDFVLMHWRVSQTPRYEYQACRMPSTLYEFFATQGIRNVRYSAIIMYVDHMFGGRTHREYPGYLIGTPYTTSSGHFCHAFDITAGAITYLLLQNPIEEPEPPLNRWSQMVGPIYSELANNHPSLHPLKLIVLYNVAPADAADETKLIMQHIINLVRGPGFSTPPRAGRASKFSVNTDIGKALLGSPQGQTVAYTLATNPESFGGQRRITAVTMFRADDPTIMVPGAWCLAFHIERFGRI